MSARAMPRAINEGVARAVKNTVLPNGSPEQRVLEDALVVLGPDERGAAADRRPVVERDPEAMDDRPQLQDHVRHEEGQQEQDRRAQVVTEVAEAGNSRRSTVFLPVDLRLPSKVSSVGGSRQPAFPRWTEAYPPGF